MKSNKNSKLDIKLVDLIAPDILQRIQDSFSNAVGMAALTTEADGKPVTVGSNFTDYCMKYTRCSELGGSMCEECDRYGAEVTMRTGKFTTYMCHSGLIDFSAPILIDGEMVGCFIGGQVLTEPPDEEATREIARSLNINEDEYWEAIQKVPVLPSERIDKAAEFLFTIASVLSDMAYGKYLTMKANIELDRASRMQGDFLANMSHEIRTPMNAVIGFAEMALREDLPPMAADYIRQIKSSGNALLAIINDILDYSKIEAGKMELVPVEYEPLSLVDDVANIIMTRLLDKDVELLLDVNPNIPAKVVGDNIRIRQILINLCNNATKFTHEGHVKLVVDYEWMNYEYIKLQFSVIDTGIGIKEEDLDKIFNSFQQVDTRRNRNTEGTGLGLSICKMLLGLMDSELNVESVYGEGSTFSFAIPQYVADPLPSITVDDPENIYLGCSFEREDVASDFINDATKLGVSTQYFMDFENREADLKKWISNADEGKRLYFFMEQKFFDPETNERVRPVADVTPVIVADTFADIRQLSSIPNLKFLRKPISVLNLGNLLNNKEYTFKADTDQNDLYSFTAEDVNVLVVDDNIVNLTVAQGLMEPLKANVDLASSGNEALHMMKEKKYDIIFMDHMMPEMDGIDCTRIIRKTMPEYDPVPIIALTANATTDARELFEKEGLEGFVAKPIEVRVLLDTFKKFVPSSKLRKADTETKMEELAKLADEENRGDSDLLKIADLDTAKAIEMLGSEKLYMNIIKSYYDAIDFKASTIEKCFDEGDWKQYSIEVHALKSASRQIGAMELGDLAYTLEMASKELDISKVNLHNEELLAKYRSYKDSLAYLFEKKNDSGADKNEATLENLRSLFGQMRVAIDDLDMDGMEEVILQMEKFSYNDFWQEKFTALKEATAAMDVDKCIEILDGWK